jgi:ribokinase
MANNFEKLENISKYFINSTNIVVMHDFFVDRIIRLGSTTEIFCSLMEKARVGGGSIREGISTVEIKGGNAVNLAYCLAKLGFNVTLFTVADEMGSAILNHTFAKLKDKVEFVIKSGTHGLTTTFEFANETGTSVNVMMNSVGDNAAFGPDRINSDDELRILQSARAVAVVNWGSNLKGTQLAEYAFKNSPKALHFMDPADFGKRKDEFRKTLTTIAEFTDVVSINENECNCLAQATGLESQLTRCEGEYSQADMKSVVKALREKVGINIDLHTFRGAAWSDGIDTYYVDAFKVIPRRTTGAGDCWDAADIIGYLVGLGTRERQLFSNACASLYVSNTCPEPPTMSQVLELLSNNQLVYAE